MTDDRTLRRPALVVAASEAEREESCRALDRRGYSVVGFADCDNAAAWLEEETPAVALLAPEVTKDCDGALAALEERDVPLGPIRPDGRR